ncbi:MAG TPA: M28 family peptidase [Verrucomicrobiae bacterium]|nr:M28 family peptidase [Verrucomicrobiae bacterium]
MPPAPDRSSGSSEELLSHVAFLTQQQLMGRKPGTLGSRAARQYIEARFKAYGLVPWGKSKGYEQSFGYGRNIVGVLPGNDPELAKEIVLVSAHYDHLGKDSKGKICPGAADNAAGVAALLKIASEMSALKEQPKRSVAFAAFDCEEWMLFGSFAFSSQPDVESAKIASVINMDILGRDLMDVVRNTLFIAGSEHYPEIEERAMRFGQTAGIRVLPLGTDLVGPRSDHVAFQSLGVPCLFFSSGTYKDYHQLTDTPEKLNRADLEKSASVIQAMARELANGRPMKRTERPAHAEELKSIITVLTEVNGKMDGAGIKQEDADAFKKLTGQAEALSQIGNYNGKKREDLIAEAAGVLAPYFLPTDMMTGAKTPEAQKEFAMAMRCLQQFYAQHGNQLLEGYRRFVRQMLKYRPNLVRGMPTFRYEAYEMGDDDIHLAKKGKDRLAMSAMATCLTLSAQSKTSPWLLKSFGFGIGLSYDGIDCEGTSEQIADFCLLRLRSHGTNAVHGEKTRKVLGRVTGTEPKGSYKELLQDRLRKGGFQDETEWIASCIGSESPDLALQAIGTVVNDTRIRKAALALISDQSVRGDVRAAAITLLGKSKDKAVLLALCDVLHEETPAHRREYSAMFREDYPFSERVVVQTVRPIMEKQMKADLAQTIGNLAHTKLKKAAKKDFGKDVRRWREWAQGF